MASDKWLASQRLYSRFEWLFVWNVSPEWRAGWWSMMMHAGPLSACFWGSLLLCFHRQQDVFSVVDAWQMLVRTAPASLLKNTSVWHYVRNIHLEGLSMNFSHLVWWDRISRGAQREPPRPHSSSKHFASYALFMCGFAFSLWNGTLGIVGEPFHFTWGLPGSELMELWLPFQASLAHLYSTAILFISHHFCRVSGRGERTYKVMSWTLSQTLSAYNIFLSLCLQEVQPLLFLMPSFLTDACSLLLMLISCVFREPCVKTTSLSKKKPHVARP